MIYSSQEMYSMSRSRLVSAETQLNITPGAYDVIVRAGIVYQLCNLPMDRLFGEI